VSVIFVDPVGFAVDWDWRRRLTAWTLHGPRFEAQVIEHQLPARPGSEGQARRAALRWWRAEGRSGALSAAGRSDGDRGGSS
jgi:hypothetical protein